MTGTAGMGVLTPPTVLVPFSYSDNFNRSNQTSVAGWVEQGTANELFNNHIICPGNASMLFNTALPSNDYFGQITITRKDINAGCRQMVILRSENNTLSGKYYRVGAAGGSIIIERISGGTTQIASAAVGFTDGDVLKATCAGGIISGYKNGSLAVTFDDTVNGVWDGRYAGVYTVSPFGWAEYDDWSAGNL